MEVKSTLLGHKLRCFDVTTYSGRWKETEPGGAMSGGFLLSASEDGTAKLWRISSSDDGSINAKCEHTFIHSKDDEVLRVAFIGGENVICTAGADGKVIVWSETKPVEEVYDKGGKGTVVNYKRHYQQACTLSHGEGQLYVCEKLVDRQTAREDGMSGSIMTAADDMLYIWDLGLNASADPRTWTFDSIVDKSSGGEAYGGARNEENVAYIFDAKPCHKDPRTLAVALSDGTVRIVDTSSPRDKPVKAEEVAEKSRIRVAADGEGCINVASVVAQLNPSSQGGQPPHVTGVALSKDDQFLVVCLGDGKVVVLHFENGLKSAPRLVDLITAHTSSCYGALFLDDGPCHDAAESSSSSSKKRRVIQPLRCVTWSSDGSVAVWNLSDLQNGAPSLTSLPAPEAGRTPENRVTMPNNTPVYACHAADEQAGGTYLACGGGGGKAGFMGIPIHLVSIPPPATAET